MERAEVTSVTLPKDLKRWATTYAQANARSLSNLISYVLEKERKAATKRKAATA